MKIRILWVLCMALFLFPAQILFAQTTLEERGYLVYIPTRYDNDPIPLVIALHGFGEGAQNFAMGTGLAETAEDRGFVVAFPNGHLLQWNDGSQGDHEEDDTAILLELIEVVAEKVNLDRDRIYLAGFSNGASMTFRAACDAPGVFAAIAAVGGPMRRSQTCDDTQISVFVLHGTADSAVPFYGGNGRYSAPETVANWAEANGCTDEDVPIFDPTFETATFPQFFNECEDGTLVVLYAISGMGHTWPGSATRLSGNPVPREFDANFLIWGFFELAYDAQQAAQSAGVQPEATEDP